MQTMTGIRTTCLPGIKKMPILYLKSICKDKQKSKKKTNTEYYLASHKKPTVYHASGENRQALKPFRTKGLIAKIPALSLSSAIY